jgi:periplasmic protein CpxP/Spy
MKKLGLILVVLMLVAGTNYAQERGGGQRPSQAAGPRQGQGQGSPNGQGRQNMSPEEMVKSQTKRLVDELKLNKEQEAKIAAIYKKSANNTTDFQKMRDASEAERTKMRETMQKTRDQQEKDIKAVLTPAQLKTYEESLKNRQNGQGRMGGQGGFGGQNMDPAERLKMQTQRLVEQYKLNKDQEAKVTAINKKYSQNQTTDFSRMRDASDEERTKMREEMQKVNAAKNKEIRAVLTADQAKLFDENIKQQEQRGNGQGRMGGFGGPQ